MGRGLLLALAVAGVPASAPGAVLTQGAVGPAQTAARLSMCRCPFELPAICPPPRVPSPLLDAAAIAPRMPQPGEQPFRSLLERPEPGAAILCQVRPSPPEPRQARLERILPYLGESAGRFAVLDWVERTAPPVNVKHHGWGAPRWFDRYFTGTLVVWAPPEDWRAVSEATYRLARRRRRLPEPARPKAPSPSAPWKPNESIEERLKRERERIEQFIRPPTLTPPAPTLPKIPGLPGSEPDPPPEKN